MGRDILLLRASEVRSAIDMPACLDAVERAFAAYSGGRAELPTVIHLDVPEHHGEIHVKAGHLHGAPYYATKFASGFSDPSSEEAVIDGLVVAFDATTGAPAAVLFDNGYITELRTGAAGGVAARWLAPERAETVAVIGTGAQARSQIEALAIVRPGIRSVRVWGRTDARSRALARDVAARRSTGSRDVVVADTVRDAVQGADVVVTCTASRGPLVRGEWLAPGCHVTAVGSDAPGKQELDVGVLERADAIVVDSRDQCARLGELQHAVAAGVIRDPVAETVELGEVIAGARPGRTRADEITVCDLTGVGVQDVAAANVVMRRASERGLGERVRL